MEPPAMEIGVLGISSRSLSFAPFFSPPSSTLPAAGEAEPARRRANGSSLGRHFSSPLPAAHLSHCAAPTSTASPPWPATSRQRPPLPPPPLHFLPPLLLLQLTTFSKSPPSSHLLPHPCAASLLSDPTPPYLAGSRSHQIRRATKLPRSSSAATTSPSSPVRRPSSSLVRRRPFSAPSASDRLAAPLGAPPSLHLRRLCTAPLPLLSSLHRLPPFPLSMPPRATRSSGRPSFTTPQLAFLFAAASDPLSLQLRSSHFLPPFSSAPTAASSSLLDTTAAVLGHCDLSTGGCSRFCNADATLFAVPLPRRRAFTAATTPQPAPSSATSTPLG